jgi:FkbM family methyltransferase
MPLATKWRFIHRGLKTRYLDHRAELTALLAGLSPADVAVDVGAHKGSFVWSLSRAVPKGRVVAFEPQPYLAGYLRHACTAARLHNVVVEAAGVSDRRGTAALSVIDSGTHSHGASFEAALAERERCRVIDVPTVALDDYFRDSEGHIGAIKIDAEGHELAVLKGAAGIVAVHRPTILCESEERHKAGGTVAPVLAFMMAQNYSGYFFDRSALRPAAEFDPRIHQPQGQGRFWEAPGYCNSFLFTPQPLTAPARLQ